MNASRKWVIAIVGLLGANMVATGVLIAASHDGGSQVIPAYYERAVHYDDAIDQAAKNRALGWRVDVAPARQLTVAVRDAAGAPLSDARVTFEGYARAHAGHALAGTLVAAGAGVFRADVELAPGWHDLTITVARGADRLIQHTALEVR